jgi:YoeB-like toxin of bacterial type II toxin-antitoxin system
VRGIRFDPDAWEDFPGIGKPEPLKGDLSGYWSRRIETNTGSYTAPTTNR